MSAILAALLFAAAAGGGGAHVIIDADRHGDLGAAPEARRGPSNVPAPSRDGPRAEDALHGRDSVEIAACADRLALAFLKKTIKKKIKILRRTANLPAAHMARVPLVDANPRKVSPRTHPAIPLLRTVLLLV